MILSKVNTVAVHNDNVKVLRSQQRFKSENYIVHTENINKIALSCNDDKRFVATDGIESYPYGYVLKKKQKKNKKKQVIDNNN